MRLDHALPAVLLVLLVPLGAGCSAAQSGPDPALERDLAALCAGFRGEVGLYVLHPGSGRSAEIRADETFPTASLVKVPILIGLFARIDAGALDYRASLAYEERRKYPGEDILAAFKDGERIGLPQLVMLMTAFSDNTASLWCQELAGGGEAINAWLATNGFERTRVNSRTPGRESDQQRFGWGQTTPREMAQLLLRIRDGRAVSPAASEEMLRALSRSCWSGEALSAIPPGVGVESKQGAVNASRSEVVLVHAPHGDYVFCVITKDQEDRSWDHDNAGFVLLRRISRLLWERFEPGSPWKPAAGSERYR